MEMYTELIFGCKITPPKDRITQKVIEYLFGFNTEKPEQLPEHEFFKCSRWDLITRCSSYHFGVSGATRFLHKDNPEISNTWILSSRANLKNYDYEIEKFLDWILPHIESGSGTRDFYAIVCYEEQAEPTIYYLKETE